MQTFGSSLGRVRHGWHPDSFASTSFTPTLYASLGYDALVHDRMDDAVKQELAANRSLEFVWQVWWGPVCMNARVCMCALHSPPLYSCDVAPVGAPHTIPTHVSGALL